MSPFSNFFFLPFENEKVILCRNHKRDREDFKTCPFCFYESKSFENQIYHAKHDCPFAKNPCQEVNCSCPKFFCLHCDIVFLTLFELEHHQKHTCKIASFAKNFCGEFVQLEGMLETDICSCLTLEIQREKRFNCNGCLQKFSTSIDKRNHSQNCKFNNNCKEGLSKFEQLRLENKEDIENHGIKFKCDYCKVIFNTRKLYKDHDCSRE